MCYLSHDIWQKLVVCKANRFQKGFYLLSQDVSCITVGQERAALEGQNFSHKVISF